ERRKRQCRSQPNIDPDPDLIPFLVLAVPFEGSLNEEMNVSGHLT
ncbi:unnamed protein product, partial [Linum tenue]